MQEQWLCVYKLYLLSLLSTHTTHAHAGEGLKVGTLALLRAGHRVMLFTDKKMWKFSVETHPTFDEKVLAVKMESKFLCQVVFFLFF